jgi:glycosyltransferase involved in cell wall biosynthesis
MRKIRLFYLITGTSVGGAEKAVLDLSTSLDKTRYEITVGSLKDKGLIGEQLEKGDIEVVSFGLQEGSGLAGFLSSLFIILKVARVLKRKKADIIHTFLFRANLIGRISAQFAGKPIVISSLRTMEEEKKYQLFLERITSFMVDKYIAVSERVKEHAIRNSKIPPDKIITIYNGVRPWGDRTAVDPGAMRRALGIAPSDRVVMVIGRLRKEKGHSFLIDGINEVRKRIPEVKLIIAGDGEEEEKLKAQVKRLSLSDTVVFAGLRRDIPELLTIAELVVLPSLWEGMPNCLLEAMNTGKPVVATTVGGIPEVVQNGETGILVPPRDSHALTEAIMRIFSQREEAHAMGMKGRKRVEQLFPLKKTLEATEVVYQEMLNREVLGC